MPTDRKPASDWQQSATARLAELKQSFQIARRRVNESIGSYPTPIPACDAQFNALLDRRRWLTAGIGRIDAMLQDCREGQVARAVLEATMASLQEELQAGDDE